MKQLRSLLVALSFAASAVTVFAQAANNNLANRFVLTGQSVSTNGTTVSATRETNENAPFNGMAHSVWYEWTATYSSTVTISITGNYRETIAAFTGTAFSLSLQASATANNFGTSASFSFTAIAGTAYKIQVDSRASGGGANNGGTFTLTVNQPTPLPSVVITTPTAGRIFTNPAMVTITATASSQAGTVTNVTFYQGVTVLGVVTNSPYTMVWSNMTPGNYTLIARATDTAGLNGSSPGIGVTIRPPGYFLSQLIDTNSVWRYLDDGSDQGMAWRAWGFPDGSWKTGTGQFGYGDDDEATVVEDNATPGYVVTDTDRYITTYFRHALTITNAAFITNFVARVQRDDGVVIYLNGVEVMRTNMPVGAVNYLTLAPSSIAAPDESAFYPFNINPSLFTNGVNVIAGEIHQNTNNSSDITFYLELTGEGVISSAAPSVAITNPPAGSLFAPGANITISASASDSDGTVTNVAFFAGAVKIGNATAAPYTITWSNVAQGSYTLTAVATDNTGVSQTSGGVNIDVNSFTIVPVTLIATGSVWKYLDNGTDQGSAWRSFSFNDSAWTNGPAQLGYGDFDEATVVEDNPTPGYGPTDTDRYITTYFRRAFTVTNASIVSNVLIHLMRDDGAIVYINGTEVRRDNLPLGTVDYLTPASVAVTGTDESAFFPSTNQVTLNTGTNIIAVEIHQSAANSSDISFEMELIANILQGAAPTNLAAPFVQSRSPVAGSTVTALTSVQVTFSESVNGVNNSDLLVNGSPATGLSGGGNSYTFTFPQPALGTVSITWATNHGIVDQDSSPLPFNATNAGATWTYNLIDNVPPTVLSKVPTAGSTLTNLAQIQVTFSEPVQNVGASDLLVNGSPAITISGSGASYTFGFSPAAPGTVNITWATGHGITDTSPSANPFNTNSAGANWSYFVENQIRLVATNAAWKYFKGSSEPSAPVTQWRLLGFDDSTWLNGQAPFYYDDDGTPVPFYGNTLLSDMRNGYVSLYMRSSFFVGSASAMTNLILRSKCDDGFICWINGTEVFRSTTVPAGAIAYTNTGVSSVNEPVSFITTSVPVSALVNGTNIIAIHGLNTAATSSDFLVDVELYGDSLDNSFAAPTVLSVNPTVGDVFALTNVTVTFSEGVQNVDAGDLLINGSPASTVNGASNVWSFQFTQPAYGTVNFTWAASHGITDFDVPPKAFVGTGPGATFSYNLLNPSSPTIAQTAPTAGFTINSLTSIDVAFSKPVTNVDAADLRINGVAATGFSGSGSDYTFSFPQPAYGNVTISWATNHGITDIEPAHNPFNATVAGSTWQYTLVDLTPPVIASRNPAAGANVTNLTSLTVTFSELVQNVDAADLLINGAPATSVTGGGSNYTFTFVQPNTSVVNLSWAIGHGITDTASSPNPFDGANATWQYFTPDNVAPVVTVIAPPPGATIRNLTQVTVTFSEPVTGVNASDLLINNVPAQSLSGSAAGPYTFTFTQPATGAVDIAWVSTHGIKDLASPGNNFGGGEWIYILNPNAVFADKIVINEIMFQAPSKRTNDEWIELKNTDTAAINLNGWQLTKGVNFTFPNVTIPAGGYLVIAADTDAFHAKYPAVTNYVGPWIGDLANHDGNIQLETSLGEKVNALHYASEGDWATRIRGPLLNNHRGWTWRSPAAEAGGPSLELRNPAMPNQYGQDWDSSIATNGTPGAANSVASTNIPPLILDLTHTPTVPHSTDAVVVSARILDERTNGLAVTLFYRNASTITPPAFSSLTMFDDGGHNDGLAGDKVYAATIPAQADKAVMEFYVQAVDLDGNTNTWPAAAIDQNNVPGQFANALYQVDDTPYTFSQPQYRLLMTETERRERDVIANGDNASNAEMNGTLITADGTGVEVRYGIGIRERGAGSRQSAAGHALPNQRVNVPTDRRWKGVREFNLNTLYTHAQYAGYLLARKAGLDTEYARMVRVFINGTNRNDGSETYGFGCYIFLEAPDSDMATAHWPLDDGGNMYRISSGGHVATLAAHQPPTSVNYSNLGYLKVSNSSENDYSDLTNLTYILNIVPNNIYEATVRSNINVEQWMLYLAMNALLSNEETAIGSGVGDDSGLYHAPRENRWYFVAHDWDTVLNEGDTKPNDPARTIFRAGIGIAGNSSFPGLASINRFLTWSNFTPIYYSTLRRLCQTTFSPGEVARTLDEGLSSFANTANINAMKQFATNRVAYVLSQLPVETVTNTTYYASNSPINIASLTVASGQTVIIQPGTTMRIANGGNITVASGGRLIAEGTAGAPILFTRQSGGTTWGNITINGVVGSPESRITHARIEFSVSNASTPAIQVSGGTVFLDYLTFGSTGSPYIHVDNASFVISHCEFPTPTASFEPVHGASPIKSGGRGLVYRNWFGKPNGYQDVIDFTGGNRPGSPIIQIIDNVFTGSDDDILDLDGTDAWVEGNIFFHAHRNGSPDSSSAVSGGNDSGNTSEITVINNIFFDCDQAATAKQGNFYTFLNNTVVHQSGAGFDDSNVAAVVNFADAGIAAAAGGYLEGNIIYDIERLTRNVTNATPLANAITFNNNLMPVSWFGPGTNNSTSNPLFKHVPALTETTNFTNWTSAQVMRDWLSLLPGSPGIATGPNGSDKGGAQPFGASISVNPGATTNDAILVVGINRTGNSIPVGGFPNGSGYTHYKWRLDGGAWSAETPIATAINLPGFKSGTHRVDVSGKRDSSMYQDDADWGELALPTTVYSVSAQKIRLNEVLASNQSAVDHEGTHPDIIELYNPGSAAVDISGLRLTDDVVEPDKFIFDPGTTIPAGGYLVVYANNDDGTSGIHIGFNLNKDGQSIYLYDTVDHGGVLIDSITFGLQLTDYSVGRLGTNWTLCVPTFGGPNIPATTGIASGLVINEILAAEFTAFPDDFVEIYNSQTAPVAMSGLFLTDNPAHWPNRSPVPALTFIGANSYIAFRADGNANSGADHLSFALAAESGLVALLNTDYSVIDCYIYGPQTTDISQGRVVNNIYDNNFFTTPTPGAPNPGLISTNSGVVINELLAANSTIKELDGSTPDWIELYNLSSTNVDLTDYSLSDSAPTPRKYVFTNGMVITGNGYLRLRCDGSLPASTTNTGFNIKAEGGSVYLFDKLSNGGGLLNAVTYGLQAVDFSIGRLPNGTGAFALTTPTPNGLNLPAALASANAVKVNEWMANPSSGEDWFELWNPSPQPVAIGGYYTSDDSSPANRTKSPIPALSFLGASTNGYQRFWADSTPSAGANHANFKLNNGAAGESVVFSSPTGVLIDYTNYVSPQVGVSEGRFPDGSTTIVRFPGTESPGDPNYLLITNVVINEALTHTDLPFEDAIELRNLTAAPINIGNWWLSDAKGTPRKYRITNGVTIPANGYVVFYEYQFNNNPTNNPNAFSLSSAKGDQIYLSTGDTNGNVTGYRTSVDFGAAQNGVPFGRYVTSDNREEFVAMSARSFGQDDPGNIAQFRTGTGLANPYPKVGPIVISQIMYHPPDNGTNDNTLDEFIELKNITGSAASLYDDAATTNTWRLRDAVDFDFPQGVSLAAGAKLLLVSFDPIGSPGQLATFRGKYGIPGSVPVYGPYTGKLANSDDKVELYRPDNPDAGFVPYVLADRVHFFDAAPWPAAADGSGQSLQRVSLTGFGNDPTNWIAALPNFGGVVDTDGDGMPDAWEDLYSLNKNDPADANIDSDGDGATNLQEYLAGTNPRSAGSVLRITSIESVGTTNVARLTFFAVSNKTYTITFKNALGDPSWTPVATIGATATSRLVQTNVTVPGTPRFFRLRTP